MIFGLSVDFPPVISIPPFPKIPGNELLVILFFTPLFQNLLSTKRVRVVLIFLSFLSACDCEISIVC